MEMNEGWIKPCDTSACVEVLPGETVRMRNSEHREVEVAFTREEWSQFIDAAKLGVFDL
jgi:hypothetical protein